MNARELAIRAHRISGMQKLEELYGMICYLRNTPPARVVELGSARGGTFYVWCRLATAYATLVSVDFDRNELDDERMRSFAGPHQRAHLLDMDTHYPDTLRQVTDLVGFVDLLHIDAGHAEEEVRADWEDYSPLLCPGGHAVLHDISDGGPIGQLWGELAKRYWSIKFVEANGNDGWGGIGVLRV